MAIFNEWRLEIDEHRSVTLASTTDNTLILTLEDPHSIAIVEMKDEEALALGDQIIMRLAK